MTLGCGAPQASAAVRGSNPIPPAAVVRASGSEGATERRPLPLVRRYSGTASVRPLTLGCVAPQASAVVRGSNPPPPAALAYARDGYARAAQ